MSDSTQTRKKTPWSIAIGIACIVLMLVTYVMASNYIGREIRARDEKIRALDNQVSTLQANLEDNGPKLANLSQQVTSLSVTASTLRSENEGLTELVHTKQYQLNLAWHEIYVLRNQTARLESQITELKSQIEALQPTPLPAIFPLAR